VTRVGTAIALFLLLAAGGCRLYFWAGDHELAIPPEPTPTATPAP